MRFRMLTVFMLFRSNFLLSLLTSAPSIVNRWIWDLLEIERLPKIRSNLRLRLVALRTAKNVLLCGFEDDVATLEDRDRKVILSNVLDRIEKTQWKEIDAYSISNQFCTGKRPFLNVKNDPNPAVVAE